MNNPALEALSKEELLQLIQLYSKNWLALDGVWFQSVEEAYGIQEAMLHNTQAWKRFTVIEAQRIKEFLRLPANPGLEGLAQALQFRFYGNLNRHETVYENGRLIYRNLDCRVQTARRRKGMPYHPCKQTAVYEYGDFAAAIDPRIKCRCLHCYPDCAPDEQGCAWEFYLE